MIYECYNLAEVKYMSKIDIISGFLGAGKTTLIKKLIAEAYQNEKIVLIENEFGEIGIDGIILIVSSSNLLVLENYLMLLKLFLQSIVMKWN